MKKIVMTAGLALVLLAGCGQKAAPAKDQKADKKEITSKLPIINNAEQKEVITRTLVFPKDEQGNQQTQTITYQGGRLQSLVIEQIRPTDPDMKEAIEQLGLEEAQKSLNESLDKDADYSQAKTVAGFSSSISILDANSIKVTSSCDFQSMDVSQAAQLPYFQNLHLDEIVKMGPDDYINSLIASGAQEQK